MTVNKNRIITSNEAQNMLTYTIGTKAKLTALVRRERNEIEL